MIISKASSTDFHEILAVLGECGLPTGNLAESDMGNFLVARSGRCIVGVAGLIIHGNVAVGHSLAVVPGFRGMGLGHQLASALLSTATELGLGTVYLFTCQAEFYFRAIGFSVVRHEEVPDSIMGILTALCSVGTIGAGHILFFPLEQNAASAAVSAEIDSYGIDVAAVMS